jgi:putative transposase
VIKATDAFKDKTSALNQMWQTDFTYLKVIGWGWFYLSTILDDFSRYVIGWKLCGNMRAEDVTATHNIAPAASGCDSAKVLHKPRLLSDQVIEGAIGSSPMARGSSYIGGDLAEYLEDKGMKQVRGAPMHPQTQGKIERSHQRLRNRIVLENYFLEGEREAAIAAFIDHYNNRALTEASAP